MHNLTTSQLYTLAILRAAQVVVLLSMLAIATI